MKGRRKVRFSTPTEGDVFLIPGRRIDDEVPRAPGELSIHDFKLVSLKLHWTQSPSDLAVYGEEDGQVQQYSDDNSSPVTYLIEMRSSRSLAWSLFAASVHGLCCDVEGLTPGLAYSFRVRAENANGCSDASPVVTTKSLTNIPPPEIAPYDSQAKTSSKFSIGIPHIAGYAKDVRYYIEGQTAEVVIPVFGSPVPKCTWQRKGVPLPSDTPAYKMFRDRSSNERLEILVPTEKDEGAYELVAENEHGRAVHEFYLQQADAPIFLEPLKETVTARSAESVQLICKVDGIPYPDIKFYKDWRLLAESSRIKIRHYEPDTWIVTITGCIVRDSGLYTCTAKNIAGGTLSSCSLSVVDSLLNIPHPDLRTELVTFKRRKFEEDYEIVELISQSANSRLYRVIERRTAKQYIAKTTGVGPSSRTAEYADWLRREADCLNQVGQAPGFVTLHDAYENTPDKSLVLIFEEIKDSRRLVRAGHASVAIGRKQVAGYVKQLLECLSTLHARNVVHLDINADNIVIDKHTRRLTLLGFTHAIRLKSDTYTTQALVALPRLRPTRVCGC
ncbi:unnamed protein product [Sphagnum balticum]